MFWIQRHMSEQRSSERLAYLAASHPRIGQPELPKLVEASDPESMWLEDRWQNFAASNKSSRRQKRAQRNRGSAGTMDAIEEEELMLRDGHSSNDPRM